MSESSTKQEQSSSKDTGNKQGPKCGDLISIQTTHQRRPTMQQPQHRRIRPTILTSYRPTSNHKVSNRPRQLHRKPHNNPPIRAHRNDPQNTTVVHTTYPPPKTSSNIYIAQWGHQSSHLSSKLSKQATTAHSRDSASTMWQDTVQPIPHPPSWDIKRKFKRGFDQHGGPQQPMHCLPPTLPATCSHLMN